MTAKWFLTFCLLCQPALLLAQEGLPPWREGPSFAGHEPTPLPLDDGQFGQQLDATPFSLADLQHLALQNNPAVAIGGAEVEAARGRWVQAGLYPNPVVGYHATEIGNLGTAGQQGGFVSQRFITAGKRRLDQQVAGRGLREAHARLEVQRQRVLADVAIRFYDALVAQLRLDLTRELARVGDELVESSRKLLAERQITPNDLLQAEIEAESAYVLLDNAGNEYAEARRRLAAAVGLPEVETAPLAGDATEDLPLHEWDECYALLLELSPELQAGLARADRARWALRRACREWIPDVDLSVSVRHHNVTGYDVTNVQVGVPLPIFDANQGNIRRARAELAAAESDIRRIELQLQDRLAVAYRGYANARQQVKRYTGRILPKAERSLESVRQGYRERQVDYLTLLTSQRTYYQVNLEYLDALRQLRRSAALIQGQLLSGSLNPQ